MKYYFANFLIFFGILTLILAIFWDSLFRYFMLSHFVLTPNSYMYNMWRTTPVPIYFEVYFFNCTNCFEVEKDWSKKPILHECGPYVYEERHKKVNITWNPNGTISFNQVREWFHRPDLSHGSMSDQIISLNIIPVTIGYLLRHRSVVLKEAANFLLIAKGEKLFVRKSVGELIFDGYKDKLLALLKKMGVHIIKTDKFAWFVLRNESANFDGYFTMNTGYMDIEKLGLLDKWNGMTHLPYYKGSCSSVNASTGELFPPNTKEQLSIFIPDICSNMQFALQKQSVIEDIVVDQYTPILHIFDQNYCWDTEGRHLLPGVRNISECKIAPAFISFPHFYHADTSYISMVDGLKPDESKHAMKLFLEPLTKTPVSARAQLQINMLLQPVKSMSIFDGVPTIFFPMIWFRQTVTLPQTYTKYLKISNILHSTLGYVFYTCALISFIIVISSIIIRKRKRNRDLQEENVNFAE